MEFRILGPLEVVVDDDVVSLRGSKQRALLTILLLSANEVVSVDRLIDDLWGVQSPESGVTALQVRVSQLRKALGPLGALLVTRPPGYVIRLERDQLDLHRFERLVGEADSAEPAVSAAKLREALALWRGPALADVAYESFSQPAIVRLEELRLAALEKRIEADLSLGRHGELIAELEALVAEHPLRERLRGQLMLALYRCARQADALAAYQAIRKRLVEELGIETEPVASRARAGDPAPGSLPRAGAGASGGALAARRLARRDGSGCAAGARGCAGAATAEGGGARPTDRGPLAAVRGQRFATQASRALAR
jgi:DNA-binding SARP family transcriptional activator